MQYTVQDPLSTQVSCYKWLRLCPCPKPNFCQLPAEEQEKAKLAQEQKQQEQWMLMQAAGVFNPAPV